MHKNLTLLRRGPWVRAQAAHQINSETCIANDSSRTCTDFPRPNGALRRDRSRASSRTQWTEDFVTWSWYIFTIQKSIADELGQITIHFGSY
jgi:hypothetical protein